MEEVVIRKILVGYDGSEDSEKAARLAASLALKYGASVVVCHAYGHMPVTAKPSEVRRLVNPVVERLNKLGIATEVAVPDEIPAQGILSTAEAYNADLIVVGGRGRGTFANLLIGSTTERVLRYAKIPVLVAR
ncbi:MAG: universal stress protein [Thermoleophilia bacterium]|nr:universal stress protein [Thermoleophilia bacterium]